MKAGYGYSGDQLISFTDVTNQTATYGWGGMPGWHGGITCVKTSGYANCKIANTYSIVLQI
ncbi:hypothetical protein, partial [Escherichia coli]|uniref:hypothetical protein n=1 Tax=Escherichia coli TaxID=562 RepID=UPI0013D34534